MVAFAYLARVLGPSQFGAIEFAIAVTAVCAVVAECGLAPYGAREVGKNPSALARLVPGIIVTRLGLACVTLGLLAAIVTHLDQPAAVRRLVLLYGLTLLVLPASLAWALQGRDLMGQVAAGSSVRWPLFALGVVLFVKDADDVWLVPVIEMTAIGCMVLYYFVAYRRRLGMWADGWRLERPASMLRASFAIGASELAWALRMYAPTLLLGTLVGGAAVGWFGGAHRIVLALHTFVWLYFFNVLPSIARASLRPASELDALIATSLRWTAWTVIPLGITVGTLAGPVVTLLYGTDYHESASLLRVLIWLVPLAAISGHFRYILIGCGLPGRECLTSGAGALVAIALGSMLVPAIGPLGPAWALVASEAAICGLAYAFAARSMGRRFSLPIWKPLLSGLAIGAIVYIESPAPAWAVTLQTFVLFAASALLLERELRSGLRTLAARKSVLSAAAPGSMVPK
jgi:O-antigen/teichoic acid export membrane protein